MSLTGVGFWGGMCDRGVGAGKEECTLGRRALWLWRSDFVWDLFNGISRLVEELFFLPFFDSGCSFLTIERNPSCVLSTREGGRC